MSAEQFTNVSMTLSTVSWYTLLLGFIECDLKTGNTKITPKQLLCRHRQTRLRGVFYEQKNNLHNTAKVMNLFDIKSCFCIVKIRRFDLLFIYHYESLLIKTSI